MGRKLYVGNLPYEIGESELQQLFASAGSVESATVMRDQATGRGRGFGFVEMSTDEEAQHAVTTLNGAQVGGRNLTVNEARPKPTGSGGGGGFGWRRRVSAIAWSCRRTRPIRPPERRGVASTGCIADLRTGQGSGFIRLAGGGEIYFHRSDLDKVGHDLRSHRCMKMCTLLRRSADVAGEW
jgi:RNA recognition motif-containing protein